MAARQWAVERQPEQHHGGAEQPAADHVGGVVPPEQHPVEADDEREQHGAGVHRAAEHRLADQHRGDHDQDAGQRGRARRVARREGLGDQLADGVLPGRAGPPVEQLDAGGQQRGREHHPDGEHRRPPVTAQEQGYGDQRRPDGHPDGPEGDLDRPENRLEPGSSRDPLRGRPTQVVETVQRGAVQVDQEGEHREQRRADPGPGQGHGAGAVEHGRQYAGRPGRTAQRGRVTDVLTRASPG